MSVPFGGDPARFEPDGAPVGLALVLPGRAYAPAAPLLEFARQAMLAAGWTVQQLWWDAPLGDVDHNAWVRGQVETAHADEAPERLLICGKSLGTRAASYAAELGCEAIWLTPLLTEPVVLDGLRANPASQLLVGGTADPWWDAGVAAELAGRACDVLQVEGADHGMTVPSGPVASAQVLVEVTRAVVQFLAR